MTSARQDIPVGFGIIAEYVGDVRRIPIMDAAAERVVIAEMVAGRSARARLADPGLDLGPAECRDLADVASTWIGARNRLISGHLAYVIGLARKLNHLGLFTPLEDMIEVGNLALIRSAEWFNPSFGYRFLTYAGWAARRSMLELCRHDRRSGTESEPEGDPGEVSLGSLVDGLSPYWADNPYLKVEEADEDRHRKEQVARYLVGLPSPRDREIVRRRFGFGGDGDGEDFKDIAKSLGISPERVRQLEGRSLVRLKKVADRDERLRAAAKSKFRP